jgi:P4 family phage/plasmid primase-like protien
MIDTATKGVTVWRDKFVSGWDGSDVLPTRNPRVDLLDAMVAEYETDAHFVPYWLEVKQDDVWVAQGKAPRMTINSLERMQVEGGRLQFGYGVADLDCPAAHREGSRVPEEWYIETITTVERAVPGCLWYQTRGGLRVVWAWPKTLDYLQHVAELQKALKYLRDTWQLPVDMLIDWARCFRLPFVRRDGVDQRLPHHLEYPMPWQAPSQYGETARVDEHGEVLIDPWVRIENMRDPFTLPEKIPAGERHGTLTRYAASLRAQGYGRADIEPRLRQEAEKYYNEHGADADADVDLARIVDWACKLPAGPSHRSTRPPKPPELQVFAVEDESYEELLERGDSVEIADWSLKQIEAKSALCVYANGVLWRWSASVGRYVSVDTTLLQLLMFSMAGMRVRGKVAANGKLQTSPLKLSDGAVSDAVRVAQKKRYRPGFFDKCSGISFRDTFVRVSANGIEQVPHNPDWCSNVGYDENWTTATPRRWLQFLDEVWSDLPAAERQVQIETTGEWIGAMLLGKANLFQKALLGIGSGANGKSTYNAVIEGLVPDNRVTHFAPHNLGGEYNRAKLARALLNTTSEVPSSEISDVATAATKGIISGDWMSARNLYETPFDFRPLCGVLLATNSLPRIKDYSDGFTRRMLLMAFNRTFSGASVERDLDQTILNSERIAIVCWALRHVPALMVRGEFRETASSAALKVRWQESIDDVRQWLAEGVTVAQTPGQGTDCSALYTAFRMWALDSGIDTPLTKRQFFDRLKPLHKPFQTGPSDKRKWQYPLLIAKNNAGY